MAANLERLRSFTFEPIETQEKRTNIFEIAGFPRRETVSSNIFAFFFDPEGSHGLGNLFFTSLINLLRSKTDSPELLGSVPEDENEVLVQTEVSDGSDTQNRIDLLLQTPNLVVGIENKVDATLYNDLDDYLSKTEVLADKTPACLVVLHASSHLDFGDYKELSLNKNLYDVTYDQLFENVLARIGERLFDIEKRSLDLLEQFIDNYSQSRKTMKNENATSLISQFTSQAETLQSEIIAVEKSKALYLKGCLEKMELLQESLLAELESADIAGVRSINHWNWDAGHHVARPQDTHIKQEAVYEAQEFELENPRKNGETLRIEFFTPTDFATSREELPANVFNKLYIKAYWGEKQWKPENQIQGYYEIPVEGVLLTDDDDEIVKALLNIHLEIIKKVISTL